MKNEKYCAAVASVSWLTDAAYPLRVHTLFLRFPNFELSQKSRLGLLAKLCGVAFIISLPPPNVNESGRSPQQWKNSQQKMRNSPMSPHSGKPEKNLP